MKNQIKVIVMALVMSAPGFVVAQKFFSRNAIVQFDATTKSSPEQIEAKTNSGTLVVDAATARVEAAVLVKSFLFEKALMQEHFNENYLESSKHPKAIFKGKMDDPTKVNFTKDGTYKVNVSGDMTLHGVTKAVSTPATITVKGSKVSANANFSVALSDYGLSVPSIVSDKLDKAAKISFSADLEAMK